MCFFVSIWLVCLHWYMYLFLLSIWCSIWFMNWDVTWALIFNYPLTPGLSIANEPVGRLTESMVCMSKSGRLVTINPQQTLGQGFSFKLVKFIYFKIFYTLSYASGHSHNKNYGRQQSISTSLFGLLVKETAWKIKMWKGIDFKKPRSSLLLGI